MVPEVGGSRASVTAESAAAMETAERLLKAFQPEVVILMSPHAPLAADAFLVDTSERYEGDLAGFGAPQVRLHPSGDPQLAQAIIEEANRRGIAAVSRSADPGLEPGHLDHGALVPLSFLDRSSTYPLVEISLSFLPLETHRQLGLAIRDVVRRAERKVAFIASGDCSHRLKPDAPAGYSPEGTVFDAELVRLLTAQDYHGLEDIEPHLIQAAGECGLRSFITLGGFLEGEGLQTRVLSYEGPWGVGYLTAVAAAPELLTVAFTPSVGAKGGTPGDIESEPVALARRTIEAYVRDRRTIEPHTRTGMMAERHGAFVSLHRNGMLRGCIGTIAPTQPTLADEIARNAIQAATADPRFRPLAADELQDLDISVDVLQPSEPAALEELDPKLYGVIVSCDMRRGLLLPDLEGVDTAADQVAIACQKAGIGPHERVQLERFCVDRYH